ncbi:Vitamin B12 transporter BtuB [Sporomusa rhizae]|uniref:TonB-dependent receptor plug domain-containing protein n=1 Tax=Sporomusa rhizae TaxID=357999 RepID=UPI00352A96D9
MKKKAVLKKRMLMAAIVTGLCCGGSTAGLAADKAEDFTLDSIVVTATRYEKPDVDVPASTTILTNKDLKNTGAENIQMALQKISGISYTTYGPNGNPWSTMSNPIIIRGVSNGTLILINGTPINMSGKYYLDSIPVENVERVEIVKGGGAVLYGSEAMGGVINIIMKKQFDNTVSTGIGNYGQRNYNTTFNMGKFNVGYSKEKWGRLDKIQTNKDAAGDRDATFKGSDKESVLLEYHFNDNLSFLYNYMENENGYQTWFGDNWKKLKDAQAGDLQNDKTFTNKYHIAQLKYSDENMKASLYYNQNEPITRGFNYYDNNGKLSPSLDSTNQKDRTYGIDAQKHWQINDRANTIFGFTYKNEYFKQIKNTTATKMEQERKVYGVYGQWEQKLNDVNSFIVSARETWTAGADKDSNFSNFSASGQFIHKLGEKENVYASVGQSFVLPTFNQMYGSTYNLLPSPELKPQTGVNYEIGWKKVEGGHSWKAAVYHIDITDNISSSWDSTTGIYKYNNEDFKNTGVELTCDITGKNGWSYNWGINYGDPKTKSKGNDPKTKKYWDRKYGRLQLTGGVTYQKDKWSTSLNGTYLTERVAATSTALSREMKPYLLTSLSTTYKMDMNNEVSLTADNLLDRNDVLSHTGTDYYATPFNYLLSYKHKF